MVIHRRDDFDFVIDHPTVIGKIMDPRDSALRQHKTNDYNHYQFCFICSAIDFGMQKGGGHIYRYCFVYSQQSTFGRQWGGGGHLAVCRVTGLSMLRNSLRKVDPARQ